VQAGIFVKGDEQVEDVREETTFALHKSLQEMQTRPASSSSRGRVSKDDRNFQKV
jgi:hypothetical protein